VQTRSLPDLNKMLVLFRNKAKYHFFFNKASYTSLA